MWTLILPLERSRAGVHMIQKSRSWIAWHKEYDCISHGGTVKDDCGQPSWCLGDLGAEKAWRNSMQSRWGLVPTDPTSPCQLSLSELYILTGCNSSATMYAVQLQQRKGGVN